MSLPRSFMAFVKAVPFYAAVAQSPALAASTISVVRQEANNDDVVKRLVRRALQQHGSEDLAREAIKANDFPLFKAAVARFVDDGARRDRWFDEAFKRAFKNASVQAEGFSFRDLIETDRRFQDHAVKPLAVALEHQIDQLMSALEPKVDQCFRLAGDPKQTTQGETVEPQGLTFLVSAFFQRFSHVSRSGFAEKYGELYPDRKDVLARAVMREASYRDLEYLPKGRFEYYATFFAQDRVEEAQTDCLLHFAKSEGVSENQFDLLVEIFKPENYQYVTSAQGKEIVSAVLNRRWITTAERLANAGLLTEDAALELYQQRKHDVLTMPQISLEFLQKRIEQGFIDQRARKAPKPQRRGGGLVVEVL